MSINKKGDGSITYEQYPFWMVAVANLLSLAIYFFGAMIMGRLSVFALVGFVCYVAWLEVRLLRGHCVHCYYFGKMCAFGRGRVSGFFFHQGDVAEFVQVPMTWKGMIPDMLVLFVPAFTGVILFFITFDWVLLLMIVFLFLLATVGNGCIRGKLACRYCKQREIGCPAERFFNKDKN